MLGVLCYEFCTGEAPFTAEDRDLTYNRILEIDLVMPAHLSPQCQDLIRRLLNKDPQRRLSLDDILEHPWFKANL
jgi:aurora kinase